MNPRPRNLSPQERIIFALDVPSIEEALSLVDELKELISFYKIGLELLMSAAVGELLRKLRDKKIFVDLKLPDDVPQTVSRVVRVAAENGVRLITLSNSATEGTIVAARNGRGDREYPKLLYVPLLSSLDRNDYEQIYGGKRTDFESYLLSKASTASKAGVDGFIVSGQEIRLLRNQYQDLLLVSPGIRPQGSSKDDHKRSCTPTQAIQWGADYIVVGRPIRDDPNRTDATRRIIDELESALADSGLLLRS